MILKKKEMNKLTENQKTSLGTCWKCQVNQLNILTKDQTFILPFLSNCAVAGWPDSWWEKSYSLLNHSNLLTKKGYVIYPFGIYWEPSVPYRGPISTLTTVLLLLECFINLKAVQILALLGAILASWIPSLLQRKIEPL